MLQLEDILVQEQPCVERWSRALQHVLSPAALPTPMGGDCSHRLAKKEDKMCSVVKPNNLIYLLSDRQTDTVLISLSSYLGRRRMYVR